MGPRTRKAIGGFGLVAYLIAYIVIAVQIADRLPFNPWVQLAYYCVAGFAWVLPLRPLMNWMHAGGQTAEAER